MEESELSGAWKGVSVVGMTLRVPTIGIPDATQLEAHSKIYDMAVTRHIEVHFPTDSTRTRR